jgi:enamine deaminase RidA (YjgF/YER057c/UK114 family)
MTDKIDTPDRPGPAGHAAGPDSTADSTADTPNTAHTSGTGSRITRINPPGLHATPGYHHITVVEAGRTAHLSGQCPLDASGEVVGAGDLGAQIDQVAANALAALAAVGARPEDVVRTMIHVVSDDHEVLAGAWERLLAGPIAPAFTTASTLVGVAQLGYPGQLVELDITASLPS